MNQENILPKISIIIPVFNGSSAIKKCLNYIYASEFKEFEVILVDDCSSDDTLGVASNYPCRILKNEINKGPAFSRNKGVDAAKGELILFVDADVLIPPDLMKKISFFFDGHKDISILQCRYEDSPHYKNLFSQYKHYIFSFRGLMDSNAYVNYVHTACVAMKKNIFQKVQFNENLRRLEDIDFGLRCAQNGYLIYVDSELKVIHKKKYDLFSFSKYQFNSARRIMIQNLMIKNKNISNKLDSKKQPLYKKLWYLRTILGFLFVLNLIWLVFQQGFIQWTFLLCIIIFSFLVEYRFRLYLFQVAPVSISFWSFFLYFYDGFLITLGSISGLFQSIYLKSLKKIS